MAIPFYVPRARFFDNNGLPLAGGRVTFYEAQTTTQKAIYTTAAGDVEATNPHVLDASGYVRDGGVWLGVGPYKILVERSDGSGGWVEEWTMDDVPGSDGGITGALTVNFVETIDDLKALDAGAYQLIYVAGYSAAGDGGQGWFRWDAGNLTADNLGTIIAPSIGASAGKWLRQVDGSVTAAQFGCVLGMAGPHNARIANMITWAGNDYAWVLGKYDYSLGGATLSLTGTGVIEEGAFFQGTGATLSISSPYIRIEATGRLVAGNTYPAPPVAITIAQSWYKGRYALPEWFGCFGGGVSNDSYPFFHFCAAVGSNASSLGGNYLLSTGGLTYTKITPRIENGCVVNFASVSGDLEIAPTAVEADAPWIDGNYQFVHISPDSVVPANAAWFDDIAANWDDCVTGLTRSATISNTLHWSSNSTEFSTNYTGDASLLLNVFDNPCALLFSAVGTFKFGRIVAGDFQIFDADIASTQFLDIYEGKSNIYWFGASSAKADNTLEIVCSCSKILNGADLAKVDGRGAVLDCTSSLSLTLSSKLYIEDLTISNSSNVGIVSYSSPSLSLRACNISGSLGVICSEGLDAIDCVFTGTDGGAVYTEGDTRLTRCTLSGVQGAVTTNNTVLSVYGGDLYTDDCDISIAITSLAATNKLVDHSASGNEVCSIRGGSIKGDSTYVVKAVFGNNGNMVLNGVSVFEATVELVSANRPAIVGNSFLPVGSTIDGSLIIGAGVNYGVCVGNSLDATNLTNNSATIVVANNG